MIHPFVALLRRYVFDYTNSHDLAVCDEIMHPDYRVHISGLTLERDKTYKGAVAGVFAEYPGLTIQAYEIVTNGEMLAMSFTEHGASVRHENRCAAWRGIGIYQWDGRQLIRNFVEQDFFSRRQQLQTGRAAPIESPPHDPWLGATAGDPAPANEEVVRSWLASGDVRGSGVVIDGLRLNEMPPSPLAIESTRISAIFSARDKVAFHVVQSGRYLGGLFEDDSLVIGCECELCVAGIVTVAAGSVAQATLVTDREGTRASLVKFARCHALSQR